MEEQASVTPQPSAAQEVAQQPTKSNNTMLIAVIAVVVIVVVGSGLWFMMASGGRESATPTPKTAVQPTTPVATATSLDKDLDAIDVEDIETDFKDVDKDLQSL